jgi:hypothetical protein
LRLVAALKGLRVEGATGAGGARAVLNDFGGRPRRFGALIPSINASACCSRAILREVPL